MLIKSIQNSETVNGFHLTTFKITVFTHMFRKVSYLYTYYKITATNSPGTLSAIWSSRQFVKNEATTDK